MNKRLHSVNDLEPSQAVLNSFLEVNSGLAFYIERYADILTNNKTELEYSIRSFLKSVIPIYDSLKHYADEDRAESLLRAQVQHLDNMLRQFGQANYFTQLKHIGQTHYQLRIDPAWVIGAYRVYQKHFLNIIYHSNQITDQDRPLLCDAVNRLLFRDMAIILEGYWQTGENTHQQQQQKLTELQSQLCNLLSNLPQTIWSYDVVDQKYIYLSPSKNDSLHAGEEIPIPFLSWTDKNEHQNVLNCWQQSLKGETTSIESATETPDGQRRWYKRTFYPFVDKHGQVIRIDGVMEDVTESRQTHNRLLFMASTDTLTGLANRNLWYDRAKQALAIAAREQGREVALMLLDLNHFKYINDTLGHQVGDVVLRMVAQRFKEVLRTSDTVARFGGDEFAILLPSIDDGVTIATRVAEKIQDCFQQPLQYGSHELFLGAAIGITLYPQDGQDLSVLMRRADIAMYTSKRKRLPFQFHKPGLEEEYDRKLRLSSQIKNAIQENEFQLLYQPRVRLDGQGIAGVEALIRWQHPQLGILHPSQFIPQAEQSGLMAELSEWILTTALAQANNWQTQGLHMPVSINVSARSFQSVNFVDSIKQALGNHHTNGHQLELEITENTLMNHSDRCLSILKQLVEMGVSISIDDFGTGFSSLSHLKQFPLELLKIDNSFINNMQHCTRDTAVVSSVIELGHKLGFQVAAEGVEQLDTFNSLKQMGCDQAQGYHIGRPMAGNELVQWATQQRAVGNA